MQTVFRQSFLKTYVHHLQLFSRNNSRNTIYALSSGQGKCGVAVIRVSGQYAGDALRSVASLKELPAPRKALLRNIRHPQTRDKLDRGLVLWFPGPHSYTGEDSFELQVHGGHAVITAVLSALGSLNHLRLAEPGEFTRRAFFNQKLDLTEVEGVADLLAAETEAQRKQALLQSHGALRKLYSEWRTMLLNAVATMEAHIDFDETEMLGTDDLSAVFRSVDTLRTCITQHTANGLKGERLRSGAKTVIVGEPNVGKSSLLNALCLRPAAIVSPIAGTTRDLISTTLDICGYPMVLTDTAGLRDKTSADIPLDQIEAEGISRTMHSYGEADLVVVVLDAKKCLDFMHATTEASVFDYIAHSLPTVNVLSDQVNGDKKFVIVANKIDLVNSKDLSHFENVSAVCTSCVTSSGFDDLIQSLGKQLKVICGNPSSEHPSMTQERHRHHLTECIAHLENFVNCESVIQHTDIAILTESLRLAMRSLGKISGTVSTEQLLDVIFSEFCVGK